MLHAQEKQNPNFTGGTVTKLDEGTKATIAHFRFDPGSRTKWHSHEGGQIILVEEGVAHTQVKGGPVIELKAGESSTRVREWCTGTARRRIRAGFSTTSRAAGSPGWTK